MGCINGRKVIVRVHGGMFNNMCAFDYMYPGTLCVFATVVYLRRPHSLNTVVKPCDEELSDL